MPFSFGRASGAQLTTLHEDLQIALTGGIEVYDFSITQGARPVEQQIQVFPMFDAPSPKRLPSYLTTR